MRLKRRPVIGLLTAAYDNVWLLGLTCKLLRLLPNKHMVRMIMELVRNRRFILTNGDSKPSRLRRPKNGLPQGSVLASLLFDIYIYDLPSIISKKYVYADDLAILYSSVDWKVLERTLSEDMTTLFAYLRIWRLKLSHAETVTAALYLHNREAKRELKVKNNAKILPFCPVPTYLGVKPDRALTYRQHLKVLRKKSIHARFAAEATCVFRVGRWCQGIAHSCLVPDLLDC